MRNPLMMQVIECFANLFKETPTYIFLDLSIDTLMLDILMQGYSRDIVGHYANLFVCFDQIVHSNNVWMIDLL